MEECLNDNFPCGGHDTKTMGNKRMSLHSAYHIIYGPYFLFRFPILCGYVGTRETKNKAMISAIFSK